MTHLSLFSGIGGMDLAAEMAGFTTVGQCEAGEYQAAVLRRHWPTVPLWRDIRDLSGGGFRERTGLGAVDVISGGFPCQPFSTAGKQRGKTDDRYLWPEMLRVVRELRPTWVVGENVAGIVRLALDDVLSELEGAGYACRAFVLPACAVGAPHRRERVAIVAHSDGERLQTGNTERRLRPEHGRDPAACACCSRDPWQAEPGVGRVADGVPHRMDRLRALGNAVVPQQFYPIFRAIAEQCK